MDTEWVLQQGVVTLSRCGRPLEQGRIAMVGQGFESSSHSGLGENE